jgi:hypothetical protein
MKEWHILLIFSLREPLKIIIGMVSHAVILAIQESEAGGVIWGQPGLHSEFKASLKSKLGPCLKIKNKKIKELGDIAQC